MYKRNFGLDLIRFFAILFVLISHSNDMLPFAIRPFMDLFAFDGVTIFFVLSGFLIGGILLKDIEMHPMNFKYLKFFWNRRWLRTLPNYFLILVILIIVTPNNFPEFEWRTAIPYFIFSQNLWWPHPEKFFTEAWSLSVEEWFYLTFPTILLIFLKITKNLNKSFFILAVIMVSFSIIVRFLKLDAAEDLSKDWIDLNIRKQVVTRLDSLFVGVLGAYFFRYFKEEFFSSLNSKFIFGLIGFIAIDFMQRSNSNIWILTFYPFFLSISILAMFPFLMLFNPKKRFLKGFIVHTSLVSYSLYLVNLALVKRTVLKGVHLENEQIDVIFRYFLFWILCYTLATMLYFSFEKPFMKLRKKNI